MTERGDVLSEVEDFDDVSLELSCGSSNFYESDNDTEERMNDIQPFRFEPSESASEADNGDTENESIRTNRLGNTDWYVFKKKLDAYM